MEQEKDPINKTINLMQATFQAREAYYKAMLAFIKECHPEFTETEAHDEANRMIRL